MDPTMTLMLNELRSVPLSDLRAMLDENLAEHESLRARGRAPGDESFDHNTMIYIVLAAALEQRSIRV